MSFPMNNQMKLQKLQVQLLYEQYQWSSEQIGEMLGTPAAVIRMMVEEEGFKQPPPNQLKTFNQEEYTRSTDILKQAELDKQHQFTPIMTTIELSLFAKVMDMLQQVETPAELAVLTRAYKQLTQDSLVHAIVHEEKNNGKSPAIAVQIINEVA